jgi:hypothetical protein
VRNASATLHGGLDDPYEIEGWHNGLPGDEYVAQRRGGRAMVCRIERSGPPQPGTPAGTGPFLCWLLAMDGFVDGEEVELPFL